MMNDKATVAGVILISYLALGGVVLCIPLHEFYPFGGDAPEAVHKLADGRDKFSGPVYVAEAIRFYGEPQQTAIVSTNGAISFGTIVKYIVKPFPLDGNRKIVAPFWADVDTRGNTGRVWYGESKNEANLMRAAREIREAYPYHVPNDFEITSLFIATWEDVGYYDQKSDKRNTFQCVIATNQERKQSFAIFLYADGKIQWTTGDADGGTNGLGGLYAQVGFNKGDGRSYSAIPESRTADVIKLDKTSNVGKPGVWIFEISQGSGQMIPIIQTCTLNGVEYRIGEIVEKDCSEKLVCKPGGRFETQQQKCTYAAIGIINGDPHYRTYDGLWHHFQGTCEYVITKLCESDAFTISAKNDGHGHNPRVSCVSRVTVSIPDQNLTIVLGRGYGGTITINGALQPNDIGGEIFNGDGVTVERIGGHPNVFLNKQGIRVYWDGLYGVEVHVASRLKGKLCGLLGTYNDSQTDDLMKPDGSMTTSVNDFGDSWSLPGCTGIGKRDALGIPTCSSNSTVIAQGRTRCNVTRQGPFSVCNSVVDPTSFIENCEFDYCCCSEEEREDCYCDNLATYAAACAKAGIPPSNWRSLHCPVECPAGMVYQQCGSLCVQTCDNINDDSICEGGCAEGCFCPDGEVLFEGECVQPPRCTACTHMDMLYQEGEQIQPNCSTRCTCRNREFQCETQACSTDGPTCLVTGSSHYQTFDLRYYEFQGDCEYILTTPCDNNEFTITAKNIAHDEFVSSVHQVTISIPKTNLVIVLGRGNGGSVTINGVLQPNVGDGMIMRSNEVEVIRAGGHPHVFLITHDVKVFWNGISRVQVTAATIWEDKLCGLCGHYNNDASDDFMMPNGQLVSTADEFSKSWVLNSNKSTCGLFLPPPWCVGRTRSDAETRCDVLWRNVFLPCNSLLDPTPFIRDCVFDYCTCNDTTHRECYCESLAAYAAACAAVGATISDWREFYCPSQCSENKIYHQCGSLCQKTCNDTTSITKCQSGCAEGCFCLDGFVVDDHGTCRSSCPVYTSEGDEFFVGFFTNRFGKRNEPETIPPVLWVTTQEPTPVDFTVSTMAGIITNNRAYPGMATYINIPLELVVFDSTQSNISERFKGISVKAESDKKLAVFGQNEQLASNDAFLALPVNPIPRVRRHEYILISTHGDSGTVTQAKDSVTLIVGTQNGTEVTVRPSSTARIISYNLAPVNSFIRGLDDSMNTITIDRYQTVYLQVRGGDISGTRVISNKPISVFSGHECANVPLRSAPCDMLVEQVPPIDTWGTEVVTIPFKTRSGDVVKVIASQDSTTVFVTTTNIMDGKISSVPAFELNAGEHKELIIEEFSIIRSNHPIAVFQFSRSFTTDNVIISDPFMLYVPPYKQYDNSYAVATAPFNPQLEGTVAGRIAYANYTNIAIPAKYFNSTLLTINNQISDGSAFKPIKYSDGSVWGYGAQLMLNGGAQVIRHQDPNATFLLTVYGFSNQMSYGYSGGSKLESQIDRPCSVRRITGNVVVNRSTVTITFSADELGAVFRCKLDSGRFQTCTSPWTQMNMTDDGNHRIAVLATCPDGGGNRIRHNFRFKVASATS